MTRLRPAEARKVMQWLGGACVQHVASPPLSGNKAIKVC